MLFHFFIYMLLPVQSLVIFGICNVPIFLLLINRTSFVFSPLMGRVCLAHQSSSTVIAACINSHNVSAFFRVNKIIIEASNQTVDCVPRIGKTVPPWKQPLSTTATISVPPTLIRTFLFLTHLLRVRSTSCFSESHTRLKHWYQNKA